MLAAIVLAAGQSTRFGSDKLLAKVNGAPLLSHALAAACAAPVERVILVCRPGLRLILPQGVIKVEQFGQPMSASLRAGLGAIGAANGVFVFLGDMPSIPHQMAATLRSAIADRIAAYPVFEGRQGHPVLVAASGFSIFDGLRGDRGIGTLLRDRADIARIACNYRGVLQDVDTPQDLASVNRPS